MSVIDDIAGGQHDGQLVDLFQATFLRAAETERGFGWRIQFDGEDWTSETVTLGELAMAERMTGLPFAQLRPLTSADHLVALAVAHLHKVNLFSVEEARERIERISVERYPELISVFEVPGTPKAPTDGSRTS